MSRFASHCWLLFDCTLILLGNNNNSQIKSTAKCYTTCGAWINRILKLNRRCPPVIFLHTTTILASLVGPLSRRRRVFFCSICCCNVCKFDLEWQVGDRRELAAGSYSSRKKLHVVMFLLCVYWFSIASFVMRFNLLISWQRAIEFTH